VRAVQSPETLWKRCEDTMKTLCNRLERHAAALLLEQAQNKHCGLAFAQRVRQRDVWTLWQRYGVF